VNEATTNAAIHHCICIYILGITFIFYSAKLLKHCTQKKYARFYYAYLDLQPLIVRT